MLFVYIGPIEAPRIHYTLNMKNENIARSRYEMNNYNCVGMSRFIIETQIPFAGFP